MAESSSSFTKGHPKMGGRKKGTPNKTTGGVREVLSPVIESYISGVGIGRNRDNLEKDLEAMAPEDRAKIIVGLVPYVLPKLTTVELQEKTAQKTFKDELDELGAGV